MPPPLPRTGDRINAKSGVSRREFLKIAALGSTALGAELLVGGLSGIAGAKEKDKDKDKDKEKKEKPSTIVRVTNTKSMKGSTANAKIILPMVDLAMKTLTGKKKLADAWKKFFGPKDVVGVKVNCIAPRTIFTKPEVILPIVKGLLKAGVKPENIIIFDRARWKLKQAGYDKLLDGTGVKISDCGGWSEKTWELPKHGKVRMSKIVSDKITKLINVPVIKDHGLAGVTLTLKNLAFGLVDVTYNKHRSDIGQFIADFCAIKELKKKCVLTIMDALRCCYLGGPFANTKRFQWNYHCVLAATDPVAIAKVGRDIIDAKRKKEGKDTVGTRAKQIEIAKKNGLGTTKVKIIDKKT